MVGSNRDPELCLEVSSRKKGTCRGETYKAEKQIVETSISILTVLSHALRELRVAVRRYK